MSPGTRVVMSDECYPQHAGRLGTVEHWGEYTSLVLLDGDEQAIEFEQEFILPLLGAHLGDNKS